jgi:hypothetical protein
LKGLPLFALTNKKMSRKQNAIIKPSHLLLLSVVSSASFFSYASATETMTAEHKKWLLAQFSDQHQKLIPVVAVADMLYACNQERKVDPTDYQLEHLVTKMDKNQLAEKLSTCLGADKIKSEKALNFGLIGCFHEQLADLPNEERKQKMALVKKAILSLSRIERQKSFTRCVDAQAIHYLK